MTAYLKFFYRLVLADKPVLKLGYDYHHLAAVLPQSNLSFDQAAKFFRFLRSRAPNAPRPVATAALVDARTV